MICMPVNPVMSLRTLRQLQIHLLQGLLHVLDVLAGLSESGWPAAASTTRNWQVFSVRTKSSRQQADTVQPVDPLAIPSVCLGTPLDLPGVAGIDQQDLEPLPGATRTGDTSKCRSIPWRPW